MCCGFYLFANLQTGQLQFKRGNLFYFYLKKVNQEPASHLQNLLLLCVPMRQSCQNSLGIQEVIGLAGYFSTTFYFFIFFIFHYFFSMFFFHYVLTIFIFCYTSMQNLLFLCVSMRESCQNSLGIQERVGLANYFYNVLCYFNYVCACVLLQCKTNFFFVFPCVNHVRICWEFKKQQAQLIIFTMFFPFMFYYDFYFMFYYNAKPTFSLCSHS